MTPSRSPLTYRMSAWTASLARLRCCDVLAEAVVVLIRFFFAGAVVGDRDADALIEEGELLHALLQRGEDELRVLEDLRIGLERGFGAALGGVADAADIASWGSPRSYSW